MKFKDELGDTLEVRESNGWLGKILIQFNYDDGRQLILNPSDARAVAAEIIACADRIDPPKTAPTHNPIMVISKDPTTPTHTSYEQLSTLAKAIAYLSPSLREELNALLATRIREVLS